MRIKRKRKLVKSIWMVLKYIKRNIRHPWEPGYDARRNKELYEQAFAYKPLIDAIEGDTK